AGGVGPGGGVVVWGFGGGGGGGVRPRHWGGGELAKEERGGEPADPRELGPSQHAYPPAERREGHQSSEPGTDRARGRCLSLANPRRKKKPNSCGTTNFERALNSHANSGQSREFAATVRCGIPALLRHEIGRSFPGTRRGYVRRPAIMASSARLGVSSLPKRWQRQLPIRCRVPPSEVGCLCRSGTSGSPPRSLP